ncbi:hypothetical protein HDU91_004155 [Kappamyces sp. JEL0680]|nr:hypothetical protein HDU91_004155 [Kappamyces sp. JEL0680]
MSTSLKLQRKKVLRRKLTAQMAESYAMFLEPLGMLSASQPDVLPYDPYYLDHPDLKTGKNKTVITLPCFLGSIIQPITASEIKKEINQHFKEAHPDLDSTLTLSQIRSLKRIMCKAGMVNNLEASSIAFAYVYLEKLILKNFVSKSNKKLIASICLLLAVKVNDSKDTSYPDLVDTLERELEVPRKELFANEFSVYAALEFSLFLPLWEIMPHMVSITDQISSQT